MDLALKPNVSQRDMLYKISCNAVAETPDGFVVLAAKTLLKKPSAFSEINVRRVFLVAERSTRRILKYFLFEPND